MFQRSVLCFAAGCRIMDHVRTAPLEVVLRRMQSSSLSNPARSLEAHFEMNDRCGTNSTSSSSCTPPTACDDRGEAGVDGLRSALSDRLSAAVRHHMQRPHLSLDDCSLMLANSIRHGLRTQTTQQLLELWVKQMDAASSSTIGGRVRGPSCSNSSSSTSGSPIYFQCLIRVMEACVDAHHAHQKKNNFTRSSSRKSDDLASLPLDCWSAVLSGVEGSWTLFIDHGMSTTSLLVQLLAVVLEAASSSSTPVAGAAAETSTAETARGEGVLAKGWRRLGTLQTDPILLQRRCFDLCRAAVQQLCIMEPANDTGPHHQMEELVSLARVVQGLQQYERDGAAPVAGKTNFVMGNSSINGATAGDVAAAPSPTSRWLQRVSSTSWWPTSLLPVSSSTAAGGAGGGSFNRLEPPPYIFRLLGAYVSYHTADQVIKRRSRTAGNDQRNPQRPSAPTAAAPGLPRLPLGLQLSQQLPLATLRLLYHTVCTTATVGVQIAAVSWWIQTALCNGGGRLYRVADMDSLLGIGETCMVAPDGTQTVLAEVLRCLQGSAGFLLQPEALDPAAAAAQDAAGALWIRASILVSQSMQMPTVSTEAERLLFAMTRAVQQQPSASYLAAETEQRTRQRRYGTLILASQLLQRQNGYVGFPLATALAELIMALPFRRWEAGQSGLGAVGRGLYLFTHLAKSSAVPPYVTTRSWRWKQDQVISYLLKQLTALLSPPSTAATDEAEIAAGKRNLPASLGDMTTVERQFLRAALRQVKHVAAAEEMRPCNLAHQLDCRDAASPSGTRPDVAALGRNRGGDSAKYSTTVAVAGGEPVGSVATTRMDTIASPTLPQPPWKPSTASPSAFRAVMVDQGSSDEEALHQELQVLTRQLDGSGRRYFPASLTYS